VRPNRGTGTVPWWGEDESKVNGIALQTDLEEAR